MLNNGLSFGNTFDVNSIEERFLEMTKTFGKMNGNNVRSFINSNKAGRTFLRRSRSEN